jgi:hypothetical protein
MNAPTHAQAAWSQWRQALCRGEPRACLRLLATVSSLVRYAGGSLDPETRAELCERIAETLGGEIRARSIRSAAELLHALDGELARRIPTAACADLAPSTALRVELADSLRALPDVQRRALSAYYGAAASADASDAGARRAALSTLRENLSLDAR